MERNYLKGSQARPCHPRRCRIQRLSPTQMVEEFFWASCS